ncbi:MAG: Maf family protein [Alphaproteobacteria bacterium]|nr:Maf family protein [Alphaproteobacteria bacterium]
MVKDFILASQSPQRRALLDQIGYTPKEVEPADIDETPKDKEKPSQYVKRMALEKAKKVAEKHSGTVILASDTVIVCGKKIIQKSKSDEEQKAVMESLSGKTHSVLTAVCVIDQKGRASVRLNSNKIKMKRLTVKEIDDYVASKEWVGCAGYKIEGLLGGFVIQIIGSYSGIVGLPLYETRQLLIGSGAY